jgi:hypothetical protein
MATNCSESRLASPPVVKHEQSSVEDLQTHYSSLNVGCERLAAHLGGEVAMYVAPATMVDTVFDQHFHSGLRSVTRHQLIKSARVPGLMAATPRAR